MADTALEVAFKRHSRPQRPTLPNIPASPSELPPPCLPETAATHRRAARSTPSWIACTNLPPLPAASIKSSSTTNSVPRSVVNKQAQRRQVHEVGWIDFVRLGTITQNSRKWIVCRRRARDAALFMFKPVAGEENKLQDALFTLRHRHLVLPQFIISNDIDRHLGFHYYRYTLEEVLCTHLALQEVHLRLISISVMEALKFLYLNGFLHGNVSATSIRCCGRSGRIVLGDCEACSRGTGISSNVDLEALGLTLLTCMEPDRRTCMTADDVRRERAMNRVFGLQDAERWSGSKQYVDFLDDLFTLGRRPSAKYHRLHDFVVRKDLDEALMLPYLELASLECFTLWHAEL